jgi:multidrug efflux pump
MGGITGQLYKQFAITIAISVVISGLVALTLSPALAALLLKPQHGDKNAFFRWFERNFERMTEGYSRSVAFMIKRFVLALLLFAGMIVLILLMAERIPSAFLPPEDQGYLLGAVIMPDAASLDRTGEVGKVASDFFMNEEAVEGVAIVNGYSLLDGQNKNNAGAFFVGFKDFEGRYKDSETIKAQSAPAVIQKAARAFSTVQGGIILPVNPPSIPGLGTTGGMEVWVQSKGDGSVDQLAEMVGTLVAKAKERPELGVITSTFNVFSRQLMVDVDREKAESWGTRRRCLQRHADHVRLAVRIAVQQVQSPVAGDFAGRTGLSLESRGPAGDLRAQQKPGHGAAQGLADYPLRHRPRPVDPFQQLPGGQTHGEPRTRL